MTTGTILVQDALCQRGILADNVAPTSDQLATGLRFLNRMMDSWGIDTSMLFQIATETFPMTAGTASYSTALLAGGRPQSIDSMYVSLNNIDYPVRLVSNQEYNEVTYKLTQSVPNICYYDDAYPNAAFKFYPIPYAAFTCYVDTRRVLTGAIGAATDVLLPAGYEKAIVDNLACYLNYGNPPTPKMLKDAEESKKVIQRIYYTPLTMETGLENDYNVCNDFPYRGF